MVKRQTRSKTRKLKSTKGAKQIQTIPQLRKAFDHMEKVIERLKKSKGSLSDAVPIYREEWRKTFKRDLSPAEAASYIKFRFGLKGMTRRKMRGGAPLSGAPLEYQTGPGASGVYGHFPSYQTAGFDRYYGSALTANCGKGQSGGSWSDGLFRPIMTGTPVNTAYDTMMSVKGAGPTTTSDPVGPGAIRPMPIVQIPASAYSHIRSVPPST